MLLVSSNGASGPRSAAIVCRNPDRNANHSDRGARAVLPGQLPTRPVYSRAAPDRRGMLSPPSREREGNVMDELTVIGAENGALIVVSEDGNRYRVPITEALHTALRQNRPAAPVAHRVSP